MIEREQFAQEIRGVLGPNNDDAKPVITLICELRAKCEEYERLAASRLADQERIEQHTAKRVAREILLIMDGSESYEDAVSEIRKKYEVD